MNHWGVLLLHQEQLNESVRLECFSTRKQSNTIKEQRPADCTEQRGEDSPACNDAQAGSPPEDSKVKLGQSAYVICYTVML